MENVSQILSIDFYDIMLLAFFLFMFWFFYRAAVKTKEKNSSVVSNSSSSGSTTAENKPAASNSADKSEKRDSKDGLSKKETFKWLLWERIKRKFVTWILIAIFMLSVVISICLGIKSEAHALAAFLPLTIFLLVWYILLPYVLRRAAKKNIFFTLIKEGTGIMIDYDKQFDHMEFAFQDHIKIKDDLVGVFPVTWSGPENKELVKWAEVGETVEFKYDLQNAGKEGGKKKKTKSITLEPWDIIEKRRKLVEKRSEVLDRKEALDNKKTKLTNDEKKEFKNLEKIIKEKDYKPGVPAHIKTSQYKNQQKVEKIEKLFRFWILYWLGQMVEVGMIILYTIFVHRFLWVSQEHGSVEEGKDSGDAKTVHKARQEWMDFFLLQWDYYAITVKCKTADGIRITADVLCRGRIVNGRNAYRKNQKWNEATLNDIGMATLKFIGQHRLFPVRSEDLKSENYVVEFFNKVTDMKNFKFDDDVIDAVDKIRTDYGFAIKQVGIFNIHDIDQKTLDEIWRPLHAEQRRKEIETVYKALESKKRMYLRSLEAFEKTEIKTLGDFPFTIPVGDDK